MISECHFDVRTFPHDVFVEEGDQIRLICGHKDPYGNDNHIWTNCKWTRPSDGLSCIFQQKKNITTNRFEINEDCQTSEMRFYGKTKKSLLEGTNVCGINVFGASLNNAGSWGCIVDYQDRRDYGFDNGWCTAAASAWLEVCYNQITI